MRFKKLLKIMAAGFIIFSAANPAYAAVCNVCDSYYQADYWWRHDCFEQLYDDIYDDYFFDIDDYNPFHGFYLGVDGGGYAHSYTIDAPDAGLFATPTSVESIIVSSAHSPNTDLSKNTAKIPPTFGSETSNLLDTGEYLTPNLVRETNKPSVTVSENTVLMGVTDDASDFLTPTSIDAKGNFITSNNTSNSNSETNSILSSGGLFFTDVTSELYYDTNGKLGYITIPSLDLAAGIYQGTDNKTLKKGVGHFESTSIWNGNVALAAHNRGVNDYFGEIHTLGEGDLITLITKLGTRHYEVLTVQKISVNDTWILSGSYRNMLTLVTCVKNEPNYRYCVIAAER